MYGSGAGPRGRRGARFGTPRRSSSIPFRRPPRARVQASRFHAGRTWMHNIARAAAPRLNVDRIERTPGRRCRLQRRPGGPRVAPEEAKASAQELHRGDAAAFQIVAPCHAAATSHTTRRSPHACDQAPAASGLLGFVSVSLVSLYSRVTVGQRGAAILSNSPLVIVANRTGIRD
jgi:hypothetical protein